MGSVHLAVRDDHYQKEVAIKILKRGMDTDSMLGRFRQERQILANLEHPFIARLLDGGSTEDGLPYFVMEYVDGLPITKYCEEKNLDVGQTLKLFRMVCEAVQYAHQNLVVHRDLKPGNILITKEGIPKLLDFGIAKVIAPRTSEKDQRGDLQTMTQQEGRLMTPAYASPEQITGLPISTAADIYALGAVLYELLTRQRAHRFESELPAEMERVVAHVEPEKPSSAVRDNARQSRELAGDLDNIILTALRKDPQRRYASAAEFSDDIRRHLEGRPVTAREDTLFYRTGKFVRRNKLAVTAGLLVAASLVGGMATSLYQARRAERRFQLVRQIANSLLFDLREQVRKLPGSTAVQMSMIQTVVRYLDTLAQDSGGDPALDLEIATAYYRVADLEGQPTGPNLGLSELARDHYLKALELLERLAKDARTRKQATPLVLGAHLQFSRLAAALGNPEQAQLHLEAAAKIPAESASNGGPELDPSSIFSLYSLLASAASERGDLDAEQMYSRMGVEVCEKWILAGRSTGTLGALRSAYLNLANAEMHSGDLYPARDNFEKALNVSKELSARPDAGYGERAGMISLHHLYGDTLGASDDPNLGDPAGALAHYRAAAELGEELVATDPKDVNSRRNLSGSYRRVGLILLEDKPSEALEVYRKAAAISQEISDQDPSNIQYRSALADTLLGVGTALHQLGREPEALRYLRRVVDLQKSIESVAPDRIWFLRTTSRGYMVTGHALLASGDQAGALAAYQEGLAAAERTLSRAPLSLSHELDRADLWESLGKYYLRLAARPGAKSDQLKTEARNWFQRSLSVWQDWTKRKVVIPYAARRESQTAVYIASCDRP